MNKRTLFLEAMQMSDATMDDFVRTAEELYAARLRPILEPAHIDQFVVIEPESGEYFLGKTLGEAARLAREQFPNRLTHAMRVGHRAALHFGMHVR